MADTGAKTCGTVESESFSGSCTVAQLAADDSTFADHTSSTYQPAELSDFSFGLPNGATIDGIAVSLKAKQQHNSGASTGYARVSLSYDDGVHYTATEEKTSGTFPAEFTMTFGGATSLWGRTWTVAEFANGTFRLKLEVKEGNGTDTFYPDYLTVTVYYTPGAGGQCILFARLMRC